MIFELPGLDFWAPRGSNCHAVLAFSSTVLGFIRSRSLALALGSWALALGSWALAPAFWALAPPSWALAPGSWPLAPQSWASALLNLCGLGLYALGSWGLAQAFWASAPRSWASAPGSWPLAPRSWALELRTGALARQRLLRISFAEVWGCSRELCGAETRVSQRRNDGASERRNVARDGGRFSAPLRASSIYISAGKR